MLFRNIRWRIAFPYVILVLLLMGGLTIYLSSLFQTDYLDDIQRQLRSDTVFAGQVIDDWLAHGWSPADLNDDLALSWSETLGMRVTIIDVDGSVIAESSSDRDRMDNHLGRPEVQQALAQGWGMSSRPSRTMGYEMLYGAAPFGIDEGSAQLLGIVRLAVPLSEIDAGVVQVRHTILIFALIASLLAVALASLIADRTVRPIRDLTQVAERMAQGDLSARLLPSTRDEVGKLTVMFNWMAEQLQEQVGSLSSQRRRLAAILEHMADGMIITDEQGQVQMINRAAARLLRSTQNAALGRSFAQVVRDHQLVQVWQQCNQWDEEQIATIEIDRHSLFVRVVVTPLHERGSRSCLTILQDLTQIRRLESVRRDFIVNISHEIRTPLASLKSLVDTLRDGAIDDPPAAQRFLDRMDTEMDELTQMVEELIELSRIESGRVPFHMTPASVTDLVLLPVERLRPQAQRSDLVLEVDLPPGLPPVIADVERIRRVITNLVHNAIKFTPTGGSITVSAMADEQAQEIVVAVRDTGVGIGADDLSRIFERFYKADRSRRGRGTGLGLAIARHTIQNHNGRIWVDSVEGEGSTFYFSLPIAN